MIMTELELFFLSIFRSGGVLFKGPLTFRNFHCRSGTGSNCSRLVVQILGDILGI